MLLLLFWLCVVIDVVFGVVLIIVLVVVVDVCLVEDKIIAVVDLILAETTKSDW